MIKQYRSSDLTDIEEERYKKFKKHHKDEKIYCYYITDFSPGVGYDIIATTINIKSENDLIKLNNSNMRNITDVDKLLDTF